MCGWSCLNHAVMDTTGFGLRDEFGCSQSPIYRRQTQHMAQFEECSQWPRTLIALSLEVERHQRRQVHMLPRLWALPIVSAWKPLSVWARPCGILHWETGLLQAGQVWYSSELAPDWKMFNSGLTQNGSSSSHLWHKDELCTLPWLFVLWTLLIQPATPLLCEPRQHAHKVYFYATLPQESTCWDTQV